MGSKRLWIAFGLALAGIFLWLNDDWFLVFSKDSSGMKFNGISTDKQTISPLNKLDEQRLNKQRELVRKYLADDTSREKFKTPAGKLGTIRAILKAGKFRKDQTYELQCLGIVFGDALAQELGMNWVMVEDKSGRDPALTKDGGTNLLFPLTMISKRVERGEEIDVFSLFNNIAEAVDPSGSK